MAALWHSNRAKMGGKIGKLRQIRSVFSRRPTWPAGRVNAPCRRFVAGIAANLPGLCGRSNGAVRIELTALPFRP
jgi:hypothetical protein